MPSVPHSISHIQRWPRSSLSRSINEREIGNLEKPVQGVRSFYGHSDWVDNLDIVNELSGHSGCVNALSWSRSGQLLASGSDDKHVNIYRYQSSDTASQFSLATTVSTGHTANIFSVKFMPHSNDRTLVSAAGDNEVRIFDLEYHGASEASSTASDAAAYARRRRRGTVYEGVRYLSDGNTNCRVFRSHAERVKRIVTESSPHVFLTCSEDGEVRQWDLRQPSSAYPAPRLGRRWDNDDNVPPPLISYKRYGLDLNTISCSPSQPHYIALGGAHLHCLLHDRRMLGRDLLREQGRPGQSAATSDSAFAESTQATRCVRKFAPNGQQRMGPHDSGHITACKISDANPNEIIVSWSGDSIYSFDLVRSPDANEDRAVHGHRPSTSEHDSAKDASERKRKRLSSNSLSREGRTQSRQRTEEPTEEDQDAHQMALRIQYGNGQTEEIPLSGLPGQRNDESGDSLSDAQRQIHDLARRTLRLRSALLESMSSRLSPDGDMKSVSSFFTPVLGFCAATLPEMKRIHAAWSYPVDPSTQVLSTQRKLRSNRESCIRFVQAAGVAARALGGKLQSAGSTASTMALFETIQVLSTEGPDMTSHEQFLVDFLKAIFLWLDSGIGALLTGFSKESSAATGQSKRFPVPADADIEDVEERLIPYLLGLATDRPVINVDTSRFEVDENRVVFATQQDAVMSFAQALKVPFADLSSGPDQSGPGTEMQDRQQALRHWALTVARGLLKTYSEEIRFTFVSRAFGGAGLPGASETSQDDNMVYNVDTTIGATTDESRASLTPEHGDTDIEEMSMSGIGVDGSSEHEVEQLFQSLHEASGDSGSESDEHVDYDDDNDSEDGSTEDDEISLDPRGIPRHWLPQAMIRKEKRVKVESHVNCYTHTKVYRGHCNVQTVKDVNFYGLNDEYVVSGSDDGNLFIWDRKTTKLLNILEGDGEVVNVIQGHPYEPMLAVSGIDDTVKIFSADARARLAAQMGSGVEAADSSNFSSINWPTRAFGRRGRASQGSDSNPRNNSEISGQNGDQEDEYVAPNGLKSRKKIHLEYEITSQNDSRRRNNEDTGITMGDILALFFRGAR